MNENEESGNDPQMITEVDRLDFNHYALMRAMRGVLDQDDYDELRDF